MTDPAQPVQAEGAQALPGDPRELTLPSGQVVTLQDVVWNAPGPSGLTLRFRFVAPAIAESETGPGVDFDTAAGDMEWLCQSYALPRLSALGPKPAQIIISLSDRPLRFGEAAPDATQFFEAYSLTDGRCTVELF